MEQSPGRGESPCRQKESRFIPWTIHAKININTEISCTYIQILTIPFYSVGYSRIKVTGIDRPCLGRRI